MRHLVFLRCPQIKINSPIHFQPNCKLIRKVKVSDRTKYPIQKIGSASHQGVDCTLLKFSEFKEPKNNIEYGFFCSSQEHRLFNKLFKFKTDGIISGDLLQYDNNISIFQAILKNEKSADYPYRLAVKTLKFPTQEELEATETKSNLKKLANRIVNYFENAIISSW